MTNENVYKANMEQYVDERKASEITGISVSTLQKWRHKRKFLPYHKVGKNLVRYSIHDIEMFINNCKIDLINTVTP